MLAVIPLARHPRALLSGIQLVKGMDSILRASPALDAGFMRQFYAGLGIGDKFELITNTSLMIGTQPTRPCVVVQSAPLLRS